MIENIRQLTVSVLMSVYNGEKYLKEAIESILNQTFQEFEFLIIDDCSTDDTWEILTNYAILDNRIRLLRNTNNIGLTRSLNRGLQTVQGEFIARQDADDVSLPDRLKMQLSRFALDKDLVLLGSAYFVSNASGNIICTERQPLDDTTIRWQMLFHNCFAHSSVMLRKEILDTYGLVYNEQHEFAQDYGLWSRLLCFGKGANLSKPLIKYRSHENNIGEINSVRQQEIATEIACNNLADIGIYVDTKALSVLREWYTLQTIKLNDNFIELLHLICQIMDRFGQMEFVDKSIFKVIQRVWMIRILATLSFSRFIKYDYFIIIMRALLFDPLHLVSKLLSFPASILLHKHEPQ